MEIDRFKVDDISPFLALADQEGWICDQWEFAFLLHVFPQGCLVARVGGEPIGFVTTVKYDRSGWVGNLLVRGEFRGCGIGGRLMERAVAGLQQAGAETIWLTASSDGRPLYEKLGFSAIDTIQRWRGVGISCQPGQPEQVSPAVLVEQDAGCWGDQRVPLIEATVSRGAVMALPGGFLVVQQTGAGTQVGPWGGSPGHDAAELLARARAFAGPSSGLFLDSPAGNSAAQELFIQSGFVVCGSTLLMYLGATPAFDPARVYALASMGSLG